MQQPQQHASIYTSSPLPSRERFPKIATPHRQDRKAPAGRRTAATFEMNLAGTVRRFSAKPAFGFPPMGSGAMACDMDVIGSLFDPKASRLFKVGPGAAACPGQIEACLTTSPGSGS